MLERSASGIFEEITAEEVAAFPPGFVSPIRLPSDGGGAGLPPADAFPTVKSVKEGLDMIDADWSLFTERFDRVDEKTLNLQVCTIPWMAPGTTLKEYLLLTAEHLSNHRMQLFMYLRLLGVRIGTPELYGG
jgi:hypothetical protein